MKNASVDNKSIGRDLCTLARLLLEYQLCKDVSPLDNAGQCCMYLPDTAVWEYDLGKISFKIDEVGGKIPFNASDIYASLSIGIKGAKNLSTPPVSDPLTHLVFDLEIEGLRENKEKSDFDSLYSSWHLDRHIFGSEDGKTKYSHPIYHFTFGGNKMEDKGNIFGDCLILPSPRISYPPMDAILGIDFILQNYINKNKISGIISDPTYIDIVIRAQERVQKPYFLAIASYWNNELISNSNFHINTDKKFGHKDLFPLLY
ncbi:hypothetical protein K2F45_11570 [Sphingobacterium siyangense]|uniref:hypothetical protein n=1 Tax=Sphingobacterium siyangense TaxID=459529 RepID=UPI00200FA8E8|nr:hypothetical protein [Sphingobacterium siyangense]UQA77575.1 hypothetical protein K2F45_11570 [Sphingobacterium siyangense]